MEDGNITNTRDDKLSSASLVNYYGERPAKLTTNGHDFAGEPSSPPEPFYGSRRLSADALQEDKFRKRINPLRIHLGKRPFVDSSVPYNSACKKKKHIVSKPSESASRNPVPRVPKLLPKRIDRNPFHNATENLLENEQDKPVPRLVPKSQLSHFKKGKAEKGPQLKEYAQSLGLQPMAKEPALSPESAPNSDTGSGGPSRVTRKVYLCSACGTYYENWNLFLHMREMHNRHICLFCLVHHADTTDGGRLSMPNGDENIEHSDESDSPIPEEIHPPPAAPKSIEEKVNQLPEREKEGEDHLKDMRKIYYRNHQYRQSDAGEKLPMDEHSIATQEQDTHKDQFPENEPPEATVTMETPKVKTEPEQTPPEKLALHLIAEHRFSATVDSITAEELLPQTIAAKVKARVEEVCAVYINLDSYDSVDKSKHAEEHKKKSIVEITSDQKSTDDKTVEDSKKPPPGLDLVDVKPKEEAGSSEIKIEAGTEQVSKKSKKKKLKDKDALLLDVNLPALNLSESDSSDESESGIPPSIKEEGIMDKMEEDSKDDKCVVTDIKEPSSITVEPLTKLEDVEPPEEEKPDEKQVLEIWDNFKKYQAKVEKQKTPPLVPIRKHVCDSDHDYCLIPVEMNGEDDVYGADKKKNKKSPKKKTGDLSSSSSSSSDSDSSCSCGSNCSCSTSSGSSSSSSSDSDSSDESSNEKKKNKQLKKTQKLPNRRISNGSNVDVMGMSETPVLVPEKTEPLIAESDLETEESETDEEFYDENPQKIANKLYAEKRNQLMLLASVAPSDGGSMSGEVSRATTPLKEEVEEPKEKVKPVIEQPENEAKEKTSSSKKRSKKKKRSKSSRKHAPIKINIPKEIIAKAEVEASPALAPNKITISLQSNTVQIPEAPNPTLAVSSNTTTPKSTPQEKKRASKRRRVPNKFYGYSSDEDSQTNVALKPQLPPKLEWRKEDLPSPVTHKAKKEIPSAIIPQRVFNYTDPIRLTTPIPDPEPPKILMNSESMESSDSDTSAEGALEIYQPNSVQNSIPVPPPTYLNSGTSSLPYPFQRPSVRQAREGESVYCYCRCPYDEVSEMIACDAEGCPIEWFHFECVGIMVPPKGKWYCPECRKNQGVAGYR
ncbi:unnamed protein product, partial [Iphiclides podalirius]